MLRKFVIEREVPGIGNNSAEGFCAVATTSNGALNQLGTGIQWVHSYVTANRITEVVTIIDPTTERKEAINRVA